MQRRVDQRLALDLRTALHARQEAVCLGKVSASAVSARHALVTGLERQWGVFAVVDDRPFHHTCGSVFLRRRGAACSELLFRRWLVAEAVATGLASGRLGNDRLSYHQPGMLHGALSSTSVANVAVIYATGPFIAAFLSWAMLRQRLARKTMVAGGLCLVGVVHHRRLVFWRGNRLWKPAGAADDGLVCNAHHHPPHQPRCSRPSANRRQRIHDDHDLCTLRIHRHLGRPQRAGSRGVRCHQLRICLCSLLGWSGMHTLGGSGTYPDLGDRADAHMGVDFLWRGTCRRNVGWREVAVDGVASKESCDDRHR